MYPAPSIGKESHKNQWCLAGKGGPEKSTLAILGHKWRTDHPFFWPSLFCGRFTRGKKSSQNDSMNNFSAKMGFHTFDARNPKKPPGDLWETPFVKYWDTTIDAKLRPSCITPSWLERVQQPLEVVPGASKKNQGKGRLMGGKGIVKMQEVFLIFFLGGVWGREGCHCYSFSSSWFFCQLEYAKLKCAKWIKVVWMCNIRRFVSICTHRNPPFPSFSTVGNVSVYDFMPHVPAYLQLQKGFSCFDTETLARIGGLRVDFVVEFLESCWKFACDITLKRYRQSRNPPFCVKTCQLGFRILDRAEGGRGRKSPSRDASSSSSVISSAINEALNESIDLSWVVGWWVKRWTWRLGWCLLK